MLTLPPLFTKHDRDVLLSEVKNTSISALEEAYVFLEILHHYGLRDLFPLYDISVDALDIILDNPYNRKEEQ